LGAVTTASPAVHPGWGCGGPGFREAAGDLGHPRSVCLQRPVDSAPWPENLEWVRNNLGPEPRKLMSLRPMAEFALLFEAVVIDRFALFLEVHSGALEPTTAARRGGPHGR
jgi:hypothetical protein